MFRTDMFTEGVESGDGYGKMTEVRGLVNQDMCRCCFWHLGEDEERIMSNRAKD